MIDDPYLHQSLDGRDRAEGKATVAFPDLPGIGERGRAPS